MRFLLDADVFSALARGTHASAKRQLDELPSGSVGLSVITRAEVAFGLEKRDVGPQLRARIQRLEAILPTVALEDGIVAHYAHVRTHLERKGTPIGHNDLWLASHALSLDLAVVTGNSREFKRVPGLRVENWLR
jgi:tRNA(fMet)-specific endonuclease VapC